MKAKQGAKEFSLPEADVRQWVQEQKSNNGRRKKPGQSQERLTATREHKWDKIRLDLCWVTAVTLQWRMDRKANCENSQI